MDNPFNALFCLIMAIWSTVMVEVWKRRENELIHLWGMSGFKGDESELPDFKYDYKIDTIEKDIKRKNLFDTYLRRLAGELPTVVFGILIVVGLFVGYFLYSHTFKDPVNSFGSSAINAVIIITLGVIYRGIAKKLVAWENHRYSDDMENSLISKNFAFQFVNAYISIFAVAFAEQDFNKMA